MRKSVLIALGIITGVASLIHPLALVFIPLLFVAVRVMINPQRFPVLAVKAKESTVAVRANA